MVYALGAVVGILLVAVVATFTMLQIHVAENADLNSELEVTQAHLSTVASSVLRLSTAPSGAAQSDDALFTELENMNSGMTMDFSAEIEEVKLGLVSMNSHIDAKVDLSAMESLASQMETNWMNMEVLVNTKADATEVYGKSEADTVLNQVDLRLSSELSGLAGTMNDFSETLDALEQDLATLGTTSADAVHDLEASFSGVVLELHEDVQALESGMQLKADSDGVLSKQQALLSVINVVEVLSGTTMDATVAETFFTEEANLSLDLSHLDFAEFEDSVNEDFAEVREDVESLEADMDESARSIEEQLASLVTLIDGKLDEEQVGTMIDVAVEDLDIAGILASITVAVQAAASIDARVDNLNAAYNIVFEGYNVVFEDMDTKIQELDDSIVSIECSWTGHREIFAGNTGCRDDLIISCANGVVTELRMRCGN